MTIWCLFVWYSCMSWCENKNMWYDFVNISIQKRPICSTLHELYALYIFVIIYSFIHSFIDEQSEKKTSFFTSLYSAPTNHACNPAKFSGTIYIVLLVLMRVLILEHVHAIAVWNFNLTFDLYVYYIYLFQSE